MVRLPIRAVEGRGTPNSRNGLSRKRLKTDIGEVGLRMPRDRAGTFEPVAVLSPGPATGCRGSYIASAQESAVMFARLLGVAMWSNALLGTRGSG